MKPKETFIDDTLPKILGGIVCMGTLLSILFLLFYELILFSFELEPLNSNLIIARCVLACYIIGGVSGPIIFKD